MMLTAITIMTQNIYTLLTGPPTPRQPLNITAVSGGNIFLRCPVSGYPVSSTTWQRDGVNLPTNYRHTVFANGTLYIRNVDGNTDKGVFHCTVRNQQNQAASGKVFVEVMSKLVIKFKIQQINVYLTIFWVFHKEAKWLNPFFKGTKQTKLIIWM